MKQKRTLLTILVALAMIMSVLPWQAQAASVGNKFAYEIIDYEITAIGDSPTVRIINRNNYHNSNYKDESLTIPEKVPYDGVEYTVTAIGNDAFNGHQTITTFNLPDTITTLGGTSFAGTKITSFTIPPLVETIPTWIFSGCNNLKTVTITRTDKVVALENTNAFNGITNNVTILVPVGMEDEYKAAANWSSMKSRITDGVRLLSFDGGGAEGEMETVSVPDGQSYTLPESGFTAPAEHQFKAWKIDNKEYAPGDSFTPTGDVTATAVWEPYTYNVTLNVNGGTIAGGKNITSYTYGTAVALPGQDEITYDGHTFAGWYIDNDFTGDAVTGISDKDTGNKVYYAKWEHIYSKLSNDAENHWYECVCGEKNNVQSHTGGKYSAPDNTITDICTVCDVSLGTATISAENSKYSGAAHAGASISTTGTLQSADFTILYVGRDGTNYRVDSPPINAGKYSAQLSIGNVTASADFEIEKRVIKLTSATASKPFDGKALTAGTVTISGDGFVNEDGVVCNVTGSQINVGFSDNTFTYELAGRTKAINYDITTEFGTLTVSQVDASLTEAPKPVAGLKYIAENQRLITKGEADGGTLWYALGQDDTNAPLDGWSTDLPQAKNVDTYYVWYKVEGDNNHSDISPSCVTVSIAKANLSVKANDKTIIYGDAPSNAGVTYSAFAGSENAEVLSGTLVYDYDYTQYGNVGNYDITPKGLTSDNYAITFEKGTMNVEPKEIGINWGDTDFTYNNAEQKPVATATGTINGDEIALTVDGAKTNASDTAYTATVTGISGEKAGNYKLPSNVTQDFYIKKADYDMSSAKWEYNTAFDYDGKEHKVEVTGLPTGVTIKKYTDNTATVVGEYTAQVTFDYDSNNYNEPTLADLDWSIINDWTPSEYDISTPNDQGWLKDGFVIKAKGGYDISLGDTADGNWLDNLEYTDETDNGSVTFYLKNEADGTISLGKTVSYKLDKTDPTGEVEFVERSSLAKFVNDISFGLFYKEEVIVRVDAQDNLSGVAKIEYAFADELMTLEEVKKIRDWTEYNDSFAVTLEDAKEFRYFIRITDKAGNETYLSTNGAEYDITAPVISGIEDGKTYYTTQKVTIDEKNIDTVTLNGEPATKDITLEGNKEATYTIIVTDKAGNTTTATVTMKPISDLSAPIDDLNKDNVDSSDEDVVAGVKEAVAAVDTTNATEEEKAALKEIADKVAELEKAIDDKKAEEDGINDAADSSETGDYSNLWLWIVIMFVSGGTMVGIAFNGRKREQ